MTNVRLRTSNGLIRLEGHARRPMRSNTAAHVLSPCPMIAPHALTSAHCLDRRVKTRPALFRMHESESWGQVHQSVKEGEGRRQDGGIEMGGGQMERKERSKTNGFMATVIIRLAENHFTSHRAEGFCEME